MSQNNLSDVATHLREQAAAFCASNTIPGYLAGVYHSGEQAVVAHRVTNMVTGAPMVEDTGFLFGSVTKLLTTTLVLQQVERGAIDLDGRGITYLPEFELTTFQAAEKIRVRNLLTHTSTPTPMGLPGFCIRHQYLFEDEPSWANAANWSSHISWTFHPLLF
jgi:CubicO group peptidase (beta-lactamase class C family)